MLCNIIDRRVNSYGWAKIRAIFEPTRHDNSIPGADQAEDAPGLVYDEMEEVTLNEAILRAQEFEGPVTLYISDGSN